MYGADELYFKIELGPTLSLKDRGTSMCILRALELERETVCLASSGNNSASISAYGARAGLRTVVFVQGNASPAKLAKAMICGGKVILVDGDLAVANGLCSKMVNTKNWFQCGGSNPYRIVAKRTVAYGICQQLGRAPDTVLIPTGGGAGMVAVHDGFSELFAAGIIDHMPRIVGVQLEACNPIAQAFHKGLDEVSPVEKLPSISDAIMNNNPFWGKPCVRAARATGGTLVSVSDAEFVQTIQDMAQYEGLFLEPAGAVTVAAVRKLKNMQGFENLDTTVCTLTGHGLNMPRAIGTMTMPSPIPPTVEAVEALLQGQ